MEAPSARGVRPRVAGKFLFVGDEKLYVRGVTYGAFHPDSNGKEYHDLETVDRDFAEMAANGLNAVRIPHTMPPRALLDIAQHHSLRVMVGLSAEQYVGYLSDTKGAPDVEALIRAKVRTCAGHPALLCYALGNEIPAATVRWLGRQRVERYLERLHRAVKDEDPDGIVTYVNYPTTEYLQLPFLDLVSFNVYLETRERLVAYLARLQNIAEDRPLLMSEVGLDSLRNGQATQAEVLEWQIRTAFESGCAGAFVFAWTDEWYRAGENVTDWAFGLTDQARRAKPALGAVRRAFSGVPFRPGQPWPRISVVVCSYNGGRTIRDCLEGLLKLDYPNSEVIVVNDGSTDGTAHIAMEHGVRVISTENRGLSSARNTGWQAATGEIVAYIDDDAYPDPHWLTYLAATFMSTEYVAVGGPNIPPPGGGPVADCVANAPGGPIHVLLSDREAEHIPGCNAAFRKASLEAIGGFDPQFRAAGDDVDVCWRLHQRGWRLGFSPAAVVWHHRRDSVQAYWKQQHGYGKAEALLERKWPDKYNGAGHPSWAGRMYGNGLPRALSWATRIYHGTWGSAPFQSIYAPAPGVLGALPLMPEWYLVIAILTALSALGALWTPLLLTVPLLLCAAGAAVAQAVLGAARRSFPGPRPPRAQRAKLRALTGLFYLLQPLARLAGRLRLGLTPWRSHGTAGLVVPRPRQLAIWSEKWQDPLVRLAAVEAALDGRQARAVRGSEYDRWDLGVRGGMLGGARMLMATEDHAAGTQLVRLRVWPRCSSGAVFMAAVPGALSLGAALDGAWAACAVLIAISLAVIVRILWECAAATAALLRAHAETLPVVNT